MNLYLVAALAALLFSGGAYVKGRYDGAATVKASQLDDYRKAVDTAMSEMGLRAAADQSARLDAERFSSRVRRDLAKVREDFNALPQVVVRDGCADLSDAFRLRWDSAEHSASDAGPGTGDSSGVRDEPLPVAR